jgi:hypothetical protein
VAGSGMGMVDTGEAGEGEGPFIARRPATVHPPLSCSGGHRGALWVSR